MNITRRPKEYPIHEVIEVWSNGTVMVTRCGCWFNRETDFVETSNTITCGRCLKSREAQGISSGRS